MESKAVNMTRFDVRLPQEQKDLFETAVDLGGFRSLTDFVISAALEKAQEIMNERNAILTSKKDREIFFKTLLSSPEPNKNLKDAAKRYKQTRS